MKFLFLLLSIFLYSFELSAQNTTILRLEKELISATSDTTKSNLLNELSYHYQSSNPKKALEYANKALEYAQKLDFNRGKAYSYNNFANININRGEYDLALKDYKNAWAIYKSIGDKAGIGKSTLGIGNVYLMLGNYNKTLESYLLALQINEELNDKSDVADCLSNIGVVYYYKGNLILATEYWQKAISTYKEVENNDPIIGLLGNIGNIYSEQKNFEKAIVFFNESLKLSLEIGNKELAAAAHLNIGSLNVNIGSYDLAIDEFNKALKLVDEQGKLNEKALILINIAEVYRKKGEFKKAIISLSNALSISRQIQSLEKMKVCYSELAKTYAATGDFEAAFINHEYFSTTKDSLLNSESNKQIAEMQTKYDTDKKDKENKILKQANELQDLNLKRQKIINYTVLIGFFFAMFLTFYVYRSYRQKKKAHKLLEISQIEIISKNEKLKTAHFIINEKHKEITDSINYAERIQRSFLASKQLLDENLKDYFVFFQPKDVVSGDFYWASRLANNNFSLVTADSTGHGVPGAIMSLLNITSLEKAIERNSEPADILNATRQTIVERLKKDGSEHGGKDGMDASLISFDFANNKFTYAAANNPIWVVRNNELIELMPDKMPIGKHEKDFEPFTQYEFETQKGDVVYTLTDGLPDQFGGPKGKKFMYKKLKELLISISNEPMKVQEQKLASELIAWKGDLEQIDDITLIGVRV